VAWDLDTPGSLKFGENTDYRAPALLNQRRHEANYPQLLLEIGRAIKRSLPSEMLGQPGDLLSENRLDFAVWLSMLNTGLMHPKRASRP
jgi:hypothetical protein